MKFLASWKGLTYDQEGTIHCIPEDVDDIYALYCLIAPGDTLESMTFRKVNTGGDSDDSSMTKKRLHLGVAVEKVDADLASRMPSLRVAGTNVTQNEWVRLGAHHTIEVVPERPLKLTKPSWDGIAKSILYAAGDPLNKCDIGLLLLGDDGEAVLCIVRDEGASAFSVKPMKRISVKMPKKRIGSEAERAQQRFLTESVDAMAEAFGSSFAKMRAIVLASASALLRDAVAKEVERRLLAAGDRESLDARQRFIRLQMPSAAMLNEPERFAEQVLGQDARIREILSNTRSARELKAMQELQELIRSDSDLAIYGPDAVSRAIEFAAVKTLLLSDSLIRSDKVAERRRYSRMIADARTNGAIILTCRAGTEPDNALKLLTGVAAILNFAAPE